MAYKDKDKQRQANREAARRSRCKQQGMTQGMTHDNDVIPEQPTPVIPKLESLTAAELYRDIGHYPQDTWVNSPEHKELMHRLSTKTVAELKAEGYWIPAWKHKEEAA